MMQCGMFVASEEFRANIASGVFTHYKREEDSTMKHGKLDEELSRMSTMIDEVKLYALILFNESFASTNEREGSEIARQIVTALSVLRSPLPPVCCTLADSCMGCSKQVLLDFEI